MTSSILHVSWVSASCTCNLSKAAGGKSLRHMNAFMQKETKLHVSLQASLVAGMTEVLRRQRRPTDELRRARARSSGAAG
jgi:hypothetical protein